MRRRNWNALSSVSLYRISLCGFLGCLFVIAASGQIFSPYPGSILDQAASRQASAQAHGIDCEVYTSSDTFEKIYGFYKGRYKEVSTPFPSQKLPNGEDLKWAFFILDAGKDLAHSQFWLKIQRPYIGTMGASELDDKDIRNISVIRTVRKK